MSVAIVSGFSTGNGAVHARESDERFIGPGMDAEDAHQFHEESRMGCRLSVSNTPWLAPYAKRRRQQDLHVGEGQIALEQPDFRKGLDEIVCNCKGDQVCIKCCTQRDLMGISQITLKQIMIADRRPKVIGCIVGEVFDLLMPRSVAEGLGFLIA